MCKMIKKVNLFYGIIYKYTNKINGKIYIGQTINEVRRKGEHKAAKEDSYFHKAIKKYGYENFKYKVLFNVCCSCSQDLENMLNIKETTAIRFYKSDQRDYGYNISAGGGGRSGYKVSSIFDGGTSIPVLQIDYRTGNILNRFRSLYDASEYLESIGEGSKCWSHISRALNKNAMAFEYFWKIDDGSDIDLSSIPENYEYHSSKPKTILQIDRVTGEVIKEFPSASAADREMTGKEYGRDGHGQVSASVRGEQKTAYGYIWVLKSEYSGSVDLEYYNSTVSRNSISVAKYSLSGAYIGSYQSLLAAAKDNKGAHQGEILTSCKDDKSHHKSGGFLWRFDKNHPNIVQPYTRTNQRTKEVEQYSPDGKFIASFGSLAEAGTSSGVRVSGICTCCKKNRFSDGLEFSFGGYKWKYKNNDK